ncbi:hypothetical protein ACFOHS_20220 [Jhaorihella thermophila]
MRLFLAGLPCQSALHRRPGGAIIIALVGIVIMQGGAIATGNAIGNLFAVGSAMFFALFTLVFEDAQRR